MSEESLIVRIAVLEADLRGAKEALQHQAREYERRLTELNHAHAQATSDRTKYLTAELFYSKIDDITKWRGEMDQWRSRMIGVGTGLALGGGVAGGGVAAMLMKLFQ